MVIQHHAYWPADAHSKHLGLFATSENSCVSLCSCSYAGVKGKEEPEQEGGRDPSHSIIPQRASPFSKTKAPEDRQDERPGATGKQMLWKDGQDFHSRHVYLIESRV